MANTPFDTQAPTPLISNDEMERYAITTAVEISYVLRTLIKNSQLVAIYFNQGRDFMLTTLLALDPATNALIFDLGGSDLTNQKFLASDRNVFVTAPQGVKIQFICTQTQQITWQGRQAFSAPMPDSLLKLQRREFFRLELPITQPYICTLYGHPAGEQVLRIHDISLGGLGLNITDPNLFSTLQIYPDCRIDLREFGVLSVGLEIRNLVTIEHKGGGTSTRMGCRFHNTKPTIQNTMQRLIAQLERERNALAKS